MKRILALLLVVALTLLLAQAVSAADVEPITPQYDYAVNAYVTLQITGTGTARIAVYCYGNGSMTNAQVTTYLERRDGASWVRVDNGQANYEWVYNTTSQVISRTYSVNVTREGLYRAVAFFKLTGDTTERITKTSTATFGG